MLNFEDNEINKQKTKRNYVGKIITCVTGVVTISLCAITIPFLTPALRRHCLPYVPATDTQLKNIIIALKHRKGKVIDLGSGDGRVVLELARHNYESHGVEMNPWLVMYSKFAATAEGLHCNTKFYRSNLWKFPLSTYDNIIIFGVEQMMQDLENKIVTECKWNCNVVTCRFPLPNLVPLQTIGHGTDTVWLYDLNQISKK
ncbi:hypothetical protein FQA39_LY18060 [Lamprigera yunnana]|nr:hypothetical protein FQA39_LY18060 [Lamprigera yunnana]